MGDMDLPFELVDGDPIDMPPMPEALFCGGLTVAAMFMDVPGVGPMPALRFNFVTVEGQPARPIIFITPADQMRKLRPLVSRAATAACEAAEARSGR